MELSQFLFVRCAGSGDPAHAQERSAVGAVRQAPRRLLRRGFHVGDGVIFF